MRFLTIFLGITLAASAAGAEALGTSSSAPATPDEAAAPETAAPEAATPEPSMTVAAATTTTSTLLAAVTALSPAITLAGSGALAISATNPFDASDDTDDVATATPAVAKTADVKAAVATTSDATDDGDAEPAPVTEATKIALPSKVPSEQDLRIQYQRVGRDLLKLEDQRGKFDCGGVIPRFKAIKLEQALATAASRTQLYVDLTDMALKIDRLRGIHIEAQCLQNPLASGCM